MVQETRTVASKPAYLSRNHVIRHWESARMCYNLRVQSYEKKNVSGEGASSPRGGPGSLAVTLFPRY